MSRQLFAFVCSFDLVDDFVPNFNFADALLIFNPNVIGVGERFVGHARVEKRQFDFAPGRNLLMTILLFKKLNV